MFYLDPQTLKRYTLGTPFTYNGVQYTAAGANHGTFISLGFTQVVVEKRPDSKYYIITGPDNDGKYNKTPRNLVELKEGFVKEQDSVAWSTLTPTDWYIARKSEIGADVPPIILEYRAAVRTACGLRNAQINACATLDQLETLMKAPAEVYDDEEEKYIVNPTALAPWPVRPT